jgi:hypothetical protein
MNINRFDALVNIELLPYSEISGRKSPIQNGYRGQHVVLSNYSTSGIIDLVNKIELFPGESCLSFIQYITPEYYPNCLWIGKTINIQEGSRVIGFSTIIDLYNQDLFYDVNSTKSVLKNIIQKEIENIHSFNNFHGISFHNLKEFLVEPFLQIVFVDDSEKQFLENTNPMGMWIILSEYPQNIESGYSIAYNFTYKKWYLIEKRINDSRYYYVLCQDTLLEAIEGM